MSKQLTLFGTSAKDNKRAGNLIYKDPKSKYEKFIERFVRRNKGQASRESVVMSRAPFHTWRLIYENASVCFCPKMPCTNVHCLTPSPPKRPVDVKRGKSEYVDSPLYSTFNGSCGYWGFPASHVAPQVLPWLVVVFQWFSLVPWFSWFPWLVCVFFCFLLFLLFLWFLMFLLFPLLVWLQSDVASQQLINLTLKMTIARFVETSVTVNNNPFQDHTHLEDHFPPTLDTGIYFHLSQYSGSFKVTLSCSKSISWQILLMYKNLHCF